MSRRNREKRAFNASVINIPRYVRRLSQQLEVVPPETVEHDVLYTEWRIYSAMAQHSYEFITLDKAMLIHNTLLNPILRSHYLMKVSLRHRDGMMQRLKNGDLDGDTEGVYMSLYHKNDALLHLQMERAGRQFVEQLRSGQEVPLREGLNY